jgi:formylglycine-generating enzyme required for sulfatase activity
VPGGTFNRSNDAAYPASVCDLHLDDYEITVGRFRSFAAEYPGNLPPAGAGKNPNDASDTGWNVAWNTTMLPADSATLIAGVKCAPNFQTWTDTPSDNENRPMNCLTWHEAFAFCIWDGGRLPTEAEWNYAAAGGNEQREYPWSDPPSSDQIDPSRASYFLDDENWCFGDGMSGCSLTDLIPVGAKPSGRGRFGQLDLAGNVWEWVLDFSGAYPEPCNNCSAPETIPFRMLRGGSLNYASQFLFTWYRYSYGLEDAKREFFVGARCARPDAIGG